MPGMTSRHLLLPAVVTILLACQDSVQTQGPLPVIRSGVTIVPGSVEIQAGSSHTLQAHVIDDTGQPVRSAVIAWSTTDPQVATVSDNGVVQGISVGNAGVIAASGAAADTAEILITPRPPSGTSVDVFPEVRYQEITGWEGTAQIGESECNAQAFALYRHEVIERLVNELGINRVRLELRSGHENPEDFYGAFLSSRVLSNWIRRRYESVNDNDDPRQARSGGFQFSELDHKVDVIIGPLRAALAARGERLFVNLNYVDFGASAWEHSSDPEEYAELIHQAFLHLQNRYGWVPDAVEVILEPDNTQNWTPQAIGKAIVATGDRLKAAGFNPAFIAPSTTNMATAVTFLDQLIAMPRVLEYLTDVAYHRYSGVSPTALTAIASRAVEHGLRTAMLEKISADYQDLHDDLRSGRNSAWQQFALAFCSSDTGGNYYWVDQSVASSPRVIQASRSRYLRQYFQFIRLGAHRVGAVSGDPRFDPLAFMNASGKLVVVIRATGAGPMELRRLPSGLYGVTFTTANQTFASLPDAVVGSSGSLQVSMPADGVITIFQR